ncbi:MAG: uroporphyrinogen decarboxylase family protein [Thermodesulfovibrionales bacterium]
MIALERVMSVFERTPPDVRPVVPEVFGVTARLNGYRVYQYVTDSKVLAESQIRTRKEMGYDALFAFADLLVEAEAIGCRLHYNDDAYPYIIDPVLKDIDSVEYLVNPDPVKDGRMPVLLEAARVLREHADDECLVAACVVGPITIAAHLMGLETFLYKLIDEPEKVNRLLDFTEEVTKVYGKELLRAGAHCLIVFDPVSSPDVIPSSHFLRFESPRLKRVFEYLSSHGSLISWISIAGPTQRIIPYYRETGINMATIDYEVTIGDAFSLCKGIVLNGNLKPYDFVSANPEDIDRKVRACINEAEGRSNFIIGTGCEIPLEARADNIMAIVRAARDFK